MTTLAHLQSLASEFYSTGSGLARSELESRLEQLKTQPDGIAHVLDTIIAPALCDQTLDVHPQLLFLSLGVAQSAVHRWDTLPRDLQGHLVSVLSTAIQRAPLVPAHKQLARPPYIYSKAMQLLAEIALSAWPSDDGDPFALAQQLIQAATSTTTTGSSPTSDGSSTSSSLAIAGRQLQIGLDLLLTVSQCFSSAATCTFILQSRMDAIQAQWPAVAYSVQLLVAPVLSALTTAAIRAPISMGRPNTPVSPTVMGAAGSAAAVAQFPLPQSPTGSHGGNGGGSSAITLPWYPAAAHSILGILQLAPQQLEPDTLDLLKALATPGHPAGLQMATLDTIHTQLMLLRIDAARFPHLLALSLTELDVALPRDLVALGVSRANPDDGTDDHDNDDQEDDDSDDEGFDRDSGAGTSGSSSGNAINNNNSGMSRSSGNMPLPLATIARKALRDIAATLAAQHLSRMSPAQMVQLAIMVVPCTRFPGASGREALRAVRETLASLAPLPGKDPELTTQLVSSVLQSIVPELNQTGFRDLDLEETPDDDSHEFSGLDASGSGGSGSLGRSRSMSALPTDHQSTATKVPRIHLLLAVITAAAELDPHLALTSVFPTLSQCLQHIESMAVARSAIPKKLLVAYSVCLRAISRMCPALETNTATTEVPWSFAAKLGELASLLGPVASLGVPGYCRALLEVQLAAQATLHVIAAHERASDPASEPVIYALLSSALGFMTSLADAAVQGQQVLNADSERLILASSRLIASIAGTLRPGENGSLAGWRSSLVQSAAPVFQAFSVAHPAARKLVHSIVCATVLPPGNAAVLRIGSPDALARTGTLRDHFQVMLGGCRDTMDMVRLLTGALGAVDDESVASRTVVVNAIDPSWVVAALDALDKAAATADDNVPVVVLLAEFFGALVLARKGSPTASELIPRVLVQRFAALPESPAGTAWSRLLRVLIEDGRTFEPHLVQLADHIRTITQNAQVDPQLPFLVGATLIHHWRIFFPTGILAASTTGAPEIMHEGSFQALVHYLLNGLLSRDVEHLRSSIASLMHVNQCWRLFHKHVWRERFHADALGVIVRALVQPAAVTLLRDDLVVLAKAMFAHETADAAQLNASLETIYGYLRQHIPAEAASAWAGFAAMWEARMQAGVQALDDLHSFEMTLRGLVHDICCIHVWITKT